VVVARMPAMMAHCHAVTIGDFHVHLSHSTTANQCNLCRMINTVT
jgi:hypothetical protein